MGVNLVCIEETKMVNMENQICVSIWGNLNFDWASLELDGRCGGILTL